MHEKKLTIPDIKNRKNATPIAEVTAYDYPWARLADQAGMDIVLVGDSLGMVVLEFRGADGEVSNTIPSRRAIAAYRAAAISDAPVPAGVAPRVSAIPEPAPATEPQPG